MVKGFSFGQAIWNAERRSRLPAVILLSLFMPAMVFIIAPFEIYCKNIAEFDFSAGDFLGFQCLCAGLFALALVLVLFFVPRCIYRYLYPICFGVLLMLFVQTNYLNIGLDSLAGDGLSGKIPLSTYIWNTALWLIVIAGITLAFQFVKIKSAVQTVALILTVAICASLLINFAVGSLTTEGAFDSAIDRVYGRYETDPRFLTNKDIEAVGSERNVIVFCVDRFDSVLYAEPAMERYPEVFEALDGFTYYSDAISMYGNTFPAVGYMMSGIEYGNDDREGYFDEVYHGNDTLSRLHELGYSIHLYSDAYYDYTNANDLPDYVGNLVSTTKESLRTEIRKKWHFSFSLTKMSLYRSLPFLLKSPVGRIDSDTCNDYILHTSDELGGYHAYNYDLKSTYDDLLAADGSFRTKGGKNFSFIHVSGCHEGGYDENWKKTKKDDFVVSARNSIEMIGLYLENMKEISPELYRDSTIIIIGDHGKVENRIKKFNRAMLTALFVKPSGAAGEELKVSDAPVSHENLWATIFESEGISYDRERWQPSVFEVARAFDETGEYPERKFIWNKRRSSLTCYDSIVYKINGEARDFSNWVIESETYIDHPLFSN